MTKPPQPELFAQRPVRSDFARRGPPYALRRAITVIVLLGIIGGALYLGFSHKSAPTEPGQIPTIKADGTYKQRPAQPGGIDIPHQDVQVYQQLDNEPGTPAVEHLLPPPEAPQANAAVPKAVLPAPSAAPPENLTPTPATKTESLDSIMAPESAPPAPVATTIAPKPVAPVAQAAPPQMAKPAPVAKAPEKTIDQVLKDVTASSSTNSAAAGTGPAIQLASTPDPSAAQSMMQKLQSKYASILGPAQLRVVKVDLAKGIYYRVQSQSLTDDQANNICDAIKQQKAGCILVRR